MKFRNVTDETREVPSLGLHIGPAGSEDGADETPELDEEQAAGFLHQGDVWHAVGDADRAAQLEAIEAELLAHADVDLAPPPVSANKQAWVDYAVAVVAAMGADAQAQTAARKVADAMTKKQLVAELGAGDGAADAGDDDDPKES